MSSKHSRNQLDHDLKASTMAKTTRMTATMDNNKWRPVTITTTTERGGALAPPFVFVVFLLVRVFFPLSVSY
jgi:hypothetical protein